MRYNNRNNKFLSVSGARLILPLTIVGFAPSYSSYGVQIDATTDFVSYNTQLLNSSFTLSDLYILYSSIGDKAAMDIELLFKVASIGDDMDDKGDSYTDYELGAVVNDIVVKESILSLITIYAPEDLLMVRIKGKDTTDHETNLLVHGIHAEYTQ